MFDFFKKIKWGTKKKLKSKVEKKKKKKKITPAVQEIVPETTPKQKKLIRPSAVILGVLKAPHITEKATDLIGQNKYVFKVTSQTNKVEIKKVIENFYQVKVVKVNLIKISGKKRRLGKSQGYRPGFVKAIVTLVPGHKIENL